MADGVQQAIATAARLDEIEFPEFTTKLVSDVFDALIAANIRQQEAFIELLAATTKQLKDYINDTKDDIGAPEIIQFLAAAAPPADADLVAADNFTKVRVGETLAAGDVTALNNALETPTDAAVANDNKVAQSGALTQARVDSIMDAVAVRIAANKYTLLQQMVKQGALRLVVEDGTIETRLNFRTFGADYFSQVERQANRTRFDFRAKAKTGGLLSPWVKARASTSYTNIKVRTIDTRNRSVTNTTVDIFGGVKINFRTDYLPLDAG
jgi:hypothetical protein